MTKALFFAADNGTLGIEPYYTTADRMDMQVIENIYPGGNDSTYFDDDYYAPVYHDGKVLYWAEDDVHGEELWAWDPKTGMNEMVYDHYLGSGDGEPYSLTVAGDYVYYGAYDGNDDWLWKTDGTEAGTMKVKQIYIDDASGGGGLDYEMIAFGDNVLFYSADNGAVGGELYISDGTELGTKYVKDIYAGVNDGVYDIDKGGVMGDYFYFSADNGTDGVELWKTDGTEAGTEMVKDIYVGGSSYAEEFYAWDNKMWFTASDGTHGYELWYSDGTSGGTQMLKDLYTGAGNSSYAADFMSLGDKMIFSAEDSDGRELWVTDGTGSGTMQLADIYSGASDGLDTADYHYQYFAPVGDGTKAVFRADDGTGAGEELWITDGTDVGTKLLKDIYDGSSDSDPEYFMADGEGYVYFAAETDDEGYELWVTDGTKAGTYMIKNLAPDDTDSYPAPGVIYDVNVAPEDLMLDSTMVHEDADIGDTVGMLSASDADNDMLTYTLKDDADGYFGIVDDKLVVMKELDYETETSYDIVVEAYDGYEKIEKAYTIDIMDVDEGPGTMGTSSADTWEGTSADNTYDGLGGNDIMSGKAGHDMLSGSGGKDTINGNGGKDTMYGGNGKDTMKGGGGKDTMYGEKGKDDMKGGNGADIMNGGKGKDEMTGGKKADTFVFTGTATHGKDTITDFEMGKDMIDLSDQGLTYSGLTIRYNGGDAKIVTDNKEWIMLEGIDKADITSDMFDFG